MLCWSLSPWHGVSLGDSLQIWKVAAKILNMQLQSVMVGIKLGVR
jgi:hypothetical protein